MGAKPSKQEPLRMFVGQQELAVSPSPSTRLPPCKDGSSIDMPPEVLWGNSRPPYLNRYPVSTWGDTSGFHDDSRHVTDTSNHDQLTTGSTNVPQGSCATTLTSSVPGDELCMLRGYDIAFLVDDCYRMTNGGRWLQVRVLHTGISILQ